MADTVMVGCKMPTGITLDLDQSIWVNRDQQGMVPVTRVEKGKFPPVTLKGTSWRRGIDNPPVIVDGYVWTAVPKDFWDAFIAQKGPSTQYPFAPLVDGYIITAPTTEAAKKIARERENEPGQHPPLVENDPRTRGTGVKKFEKTE